MAQKIISEFENYTLLLEYKKEYRSQSKAQSEAELEEDLINTLQKIGYEYRPDIKNEKDLIDNLRIQLEKLNAHRIPGFKFTDEEWDGFLSNHITGSHNWGIENRTEKIQGDKYQVELERGGENFEHIRFIDRLCPDNNFLQVINQYRDEEGGSRYDVTILLNGLPMVQIELKKRGVSIKEAFFQIDNYKNNSYSSSYRLFEFIQIFVISNGTDTKYCSNTSKQNRKEKNKENNSFLFTSYWSDSQNTKIEELIDFSETFLHPRVLKRIIAKYCVFDTNKQLKILRPYQIAAIEKIQERVKIAINHGLNGKHSGGYI